MALELAVGGTPCHIDTFGQSSPGRLPLLFLHGAANDRDVWLDVARGMAAAGHRVLVPDLPGHGLSHGAPLTSIEALAEWVLRLLDAAGVERAALIGHSMGSLIALEAAASHPQRIGRLALLGSTVPMPVAEALLAAAKKDPDGACRMIARSSHTPQFYLWGGRGHGVWGPGATLAILRRSPPGVLAIDLANCNAYLHGLEAAAAVRCPTLLLLARRDRMTPPRGVEALHNALPAVTRADIPDCGHAMMNEAPLQVVAALSSFLD